jgi:hypothetical protein
MSTGILFCFVFEHEGVVAKKMIETVAPRSISTRVYSFSYVCIYLVNGWMGGGLMDTFENKNKIKIRARELSLPVGFVHEQKTGCWLLELGESSVSAGGGGKKQGG